MSLETVTLHKNLLNVERPFKGSRHVQIPHDVLPVAVNSTNPAENERKHAHKSISNRQSVRIIRHEKGIENTSPVGLSGSITSTTSEFFRLRNDGGRTEQTRGDTRGQDGGAQRPEHQSELLGSHPHDGHDHEGQLTLFRVRFSDDTAMLIDATNKEHAAALGQAWSRHWDRLDPRRVVNVTKL